MMQPSHVSNKFSNKMRKLDLLLSFRELSKWFPDGCYGVVFCILFPDYRYEFDDKTPREGIKTLLIRYIGMLPAVIGSSQRSMFAKRSLNDAMHHHFF